MTKERLAIIGAGELGLQALHYAELSGQYSVVAFFDDNAKDDINGLPVLGTFEELASQYLNGAFDKVFISLGYRHLQKRKGLYDRIKSLSIPLGSIIAPNVFIDPSASVGEGCMLYPGVIIDKQAAIDPNVILNLGCVISHDSKVCSHSFFAPRVTVAGFSTIGEKCFLGCGSTIIDDIEISQDVVLGAGSLVVKNITESGLYFGIPARKQGSVV